MLRFWTATRPSAPRSGFRPAFTPHLAFKLGVAPFQLHLLIRMSGAVGAAMLMQPVVERTDADVQVLSGLLASVVLIDDQRDGRAFKLSRIGAAFHDGRPS